MPDCRWSSHPRRRRGLREILRRGNGAGAVTALLPASPASQALADAAVELGLYISFSGVVTFKNSQALRDVAASLPLERMLVETDAPFLAPTPHAASATSPHSRPRPRPLWRASRGCPTRTSPPRRPPMRCGCSPQMRRCAKGNAPRALHVRFSRCSSSGGVPRVGQGWGKCDSDEPQEPPARCSLLLSQAKAPADQCG